MFTTISQTASLVTPFIILIMTWFLFRHQEKFKADLQDEINKKNSLNLKRIECVSKIYFSLVEFLHYQEGFVGCTAKNDSEKEQQRKTVSKYLFRYLMAFSKNCIFLPEETENQMKKNNEELSKIACDWSKKSCDIFDVKEEIENFKKENHAEIKKFLRSLIATMDER